MLRDLKADNVLLTDRCTDDLTEPGDSGLAREYVALKNVPYSPEAVQTYYTSSGVEPAHWKFIWFASKMYGVFVSPS